MPEDKNIFDMIVVNFGEKETYARPYEFIKDEEDNFIAAATAATSCPSCGHGVDVDLESWDNNVRLFVVCANCGCGEEYFKDDMSTNLHNDIQVEVSNPKRKMLEETVANIINQSISVKDVGSIEIDMPSGELRSSCPFVDPIQLELFAVE